MLGLGLGLTPGNPLFGVGGYTEEQVYLGAGLEDGVSSGYTGTPGKTATARTTVQGNTTVAGWPQDVGPSNNSVTFNQESDVTDFIAANALFGTASGSSPSTEADPHIISNLFIRQFTVANNDLTAAFTWNDTSGTPYWIKFTNIDFGDGNFLGNTVGDLYINAPTGGGAIIDHCTISHSHNLSVDAAIIVVNGTTRFNLCHFNWANDSKCVYKAGANAIIDVVDCLWDTAGGVWSGSGRLFKNRVAGGSLTITTSTFDIAVQAVTLFDAYNDWSVTLDRVTWNASNATAGGPLFQTTAADDMTEPWTSGLTATNCTFNMGTGALSLLGYSNPNSPSLYNIFSNWTFTNCVFNRNTLPASVARLVSLGDNAGTYPNVPTTIVFDWCRFIEPYAVAKVAGYEVFEMFKCADVTVSYCWCDGASEDAFEFVSPIRNNIIHHSGGGDWSGGATGNYINGNIADFYAAFGVSQASAAWDSAGGNLGGHQAHHIWGECRGDAVVVDCVHNVAIHSINAVNNIGTPMTQNPPVSNVRLHSRSSSGTASLNGVTVTGPLTAVGDSYQGFPCKLTHEFAATNGTTTVSGTALSGASTVTLASSTGFLAGDMIKVTLVGGTTYHYTTQVGAPAAAVITIADNMPSDSALNAVVERFTPYTAGTVTWVDGLGGSKTGTDGVVDGQG